MFTEKDQAKLDELLAKEKEVGRGKDPQLAKQIKALIKRKKKGSDDSSKGKKSSGFKPGNDFAWWSKEPLLLKDAANIKSNWIPGTAFDDVEAPFTVSGVMRLQVINTYGADRKATDNINLWARDLYLRMFQKYRGITAYEAADLGIVILAGIEVFMVVAKLERIYGVLNRYSKSNVNLPRTELEALGLSLTEADYLRDHLSDFRYDLNVLIKKIQRICIPSDMTILANKLSLFGYEYLDHDNIKAQVIIFDYDNYGIFDETTLTTGSSLKTGNPASLGYDLIDFTPGVDNMFPLLDAMIEALVGSTSVQKIYGDLVTWFGEDQMLKFLELEEGYTVIPSYSESILHKIHNLMYVDCKSRITVLDSRMVAADATNIQTALSSDIGYVYQVDNCIVTKLAVKHPGPLAEGWKLVAGSGYSIPVYPTSFWNGVINPHSVLDTYRAGMDEETVTEGCLFKYRTDHYSFVESGNTYYGAVVLSAAFEMIVRIELFTLDFGNDTISTQRVNLNNTSIPDAAQNAGYLALIDWAPLSYVINNMWHLGGLFGDVDECVFMNETALTKVQRSAVLSGLKTDIKVKENAQH